MDGRSTDTTTTRGARRGIYRDVYMNIYCMHISGDISTCNANTCGCCERMSFVLQLSHDSYLHFHGGALHSLSQDGGRPYMKLFTNNPDTTILCPVSSKDTSQSNDIPRRYCICRGLWDREYTKNCIWSMPRCCIPSTSATV